MTTTTGRMGVRALLLGADDADASALLARSAEQQGVAATVGAAVADLTAGGRHAVCDEVGHVADGLLDLDITDVLASGWRKQSDLAAAAHRTADAPGSEELVQLATHRITSKHRPLVHVSVDGVEVTRVELELTLAIIVRGMLGVVSRGRLVALRAGSCDVTGTLVCEHLKVAERTRTYDLPGEVGLGSGIDLLRTGTRPTAGHGGH
jgi:hypothetical protein